MLKSFWGGFCLFIVSILGACPLEASDLNGDQENFTAPLSFRYYIAHYELTDTDRRLIRKQQPLPPIVLRCSLMCPFEKLENKFDDDKASPLDADDYPKIKGNGHYKWLQRVEQLAWDYRAAIRNKDTTKKNYDNEQIRYNTAKENGEDLKIDGMFSPSYEKALASAKTVSEEKQKVYVDFLNTLIGTHGLYWTIDHDKVHELFFTYYYKITTQDSLIKNKKQRPYYSHPSTLTGAYRINGVVVAPRNLTMELRGLASIIEYLEIKNYACNEALIRQGEIVSKCGGWAKENFGYWNQLPDMINEAVNLIREKTTKQLKLSLNMLSEDLRERVKKNRDKNDKRIRGSDPSWLTSEPDFIEDAEKHKKVYDGLDVVEEQDILHVFKNTATAIKFKVIKNRRYEPQKVTLYLTLQGEVSGTFESNHTPAIIKNNNNTIDFFINTQMGVKNISKLLEIHQDELNGFFQEANTQKKKILERNHPIIQIALKEGQTPQAEEFKRSNGMPFEDQYTSLPKEFVSFEFSAFHRTLWKRVQSQLLKCFTDDNVKHKKHFAHPKKNGEFAFYWIPIEQGHQANEVTAEVRLKKAQDAAMSNPIFWENSLMTQPKMYSMQEQALKKYHESSKTFCQLLQNQRNLNEKLHIKPTCLGFSSYLPTPWELYKKAFPISLFTPSEMYEQESTLVPCKSFLLFKAISGVNLEIKKLILNNLKIRTFYNFYGLTQLESLKLSNNLIEVIPEGIFTGMTGLTSLNLSNNKIRTIDKRAFSNVGNLTDLDLSKNALADDDPVQATSDDDNWDMEKALDKLGNEGVLNIICDLKNLKRLNISENALIKTLTPLSGLPIQSLNASTTGVIIDDIHLPQTLDHLIELHLVAVSKKPNEKEKDAMYFKKKYTTLQTLTLGPSEKPRQYKWDLPNIQIVPENSNCSVGGPNQINSNPLKRSRKKDSREDVPETLPTNNSLKNFADLRLTVNTYDASLEVPKLESLPAHIISDSNISLTMNPKKYELTSHQKQIYKHFFPKANLKQISSEFFVKDILDGIKKTLESRFEFCAKILFSLDANMDQSTQNFILDTPNVEKITSIQESVKRSKIDGFAIVPIVSDCSFLSFNGLKGDKNVGNEEVNTLKTKTQDRYISINDLKKEGQLPPYMPCFNLTYDQILDAIDLVKDFKEMMKANNSPNLKTTKKDNSSCSQQ